MARIRPTPTTGTPILVATLTGSHKEPMAKRNAAAISAAFMAGIVHETEGR